MTLDTGGLRQDRRTRTRDLGWDKTTGLVTDTGLRG